MIIEDIIVKDPEVCFGKPHIKGTRIKVSFILKLLSSGWSIEQILKEYKRLTKEQVNSCLKYAEYIVDIYEEKAEVSNEV